MVTVPYGQQVLYAHAGTIRSGTTEVILSGQTWGMPPQFPGPVTLYLERTAGTPADTVNDCVVRVLPRGAGGFCLKVRGQPSKRFPSPAQTSRLRSWVRACCRLRTRPLPL